MDKKIISICSAVIAVAVLFTIIVAYFTDPQRAIRQKLNAGASEFKPDEIASFKSGEGSYKLSFTAVYEVPPDTDEENPPEAERVVVVVYEYTNDDIENGLVISETHFKAYDKSGKELEIYPQKNLFEPGSVGESGTMTASVAFAHNSPDNYIEVDYFNDVSSKIPDTVYKGEW